MTMWSELWGFKGVDGCGFGFDLVRAMLGLGFIGSTTGWQSIMDD
jgi:hypothetical protein